MPGSSSRSSRRSSGWTGSPMPTPTASPGGCGGSWWSGWSEGDAKRFQSLSLNSSQGIADPGSCLCSARPLSISAHSSSVRGGPSHSPVSSSQRSSAIELLLLTFLLAHEYTLDKGYCFLGTCPALVVMPTPPPLTPPAPFP